jgi:hypothetical protein
MLRVMKLAQWCQNDDALEVSVCFPDKVIDLASAGDTWGFCEEFCNNRVSVLRIYNEKFV